MVATGLDKPEQEARRQIDTMLVAAGWDVQDKKNMNLAAAPGIAVREFLTRAGPADYLLFLGNQLVGVIEAKKAGAHIADVVAQAREHAKTPSERLQVPVDPLPFLYESTGVETFFTNGLAPEPRARRVFSFHRPETLRAWLDAELDRREGRPGAPPAPTLKGRMRLAPPLNSVGMLPAQVRAVENLEASFREGKPRALIQMATGAGKTFTAISSIYRLVKEGGAKRVLFLVDRRILAHQALKEFQAYSTPDDGRKFTELYNVVNLADNKVDPVNKVVISTIQRLYSILKGDEFISGDQEEVSAFAGSGSALVREPQSVAYNPILPPEFFDVVVIDECHRSIYALWRQVLEYFDATLVGFTATPSEQAYAFFNQNVVSEYSRAQAVSVPQPPTSPKSQPFTVAPPSADLAPTRADPDSRSFPYEAHAPEAVPLPDSPTTRSSRDEPAPPPPFARPTTTAYRAFIMYSKDDEALLVEFEKHLAPLRHAGRIADWNDRKILAGSKWRETILQHHDDASIFFLLVSSSLLATDFVMLLELPLALDRLDRNDALIIPIIIRPCGWERVPFLKVLQALPAKKPPITSWQNPDEAWLAVINGICDCLDARQAGGLPASLLPPAQEPQEARTHAHQLTHNPAVRGAPPTGTLASRSESDSSSEDAMELRLTSILASSEKLASSLERRLTLPESPPTPGSYVTAARAARRICELGKGGDAARKLVASCFNAVLHKDGDARGDRNTARNVLCTWLPYGYPEVARTTVLRLSGRPPDPRNLEAATCREQFVEVFMAHLDGRECKFTKAVVDQFGSHSIAQSMFFAPPGASERQSPDQIAEILVKAFRSRYAVDSVTSLQSRIFVESEKGDTPYLLVRAAMRPLAMPDAALARLNETFEELRIIVLPDAPTPSDNEKSESILWTRLIDLLAD